MSAAGAKRARRMLATGAGLALSALGVHLLVAPPVRAVPPNLVVITLDTTRPDFLGAYAGTVPGRTDGIGTHTPALDALARDGTRFDLAISSSALTPVSHASIFTGMDNHEHGLRVLSAESGYRLADSIPTLASLLKARGYRTVAIHSAFPVAGVFGFGRGFDVFESLETRLPDGTQEGSWDMEGFQRRSDETTALTLDRLREVTTPFYLWVHYWDPHDPLELPPVEFVQAVAPRLAPAGTARLSKRAEQRLLYSTEVAYMDAQIGALMKGLAERKLLDDTLIVVVADHGQGLGDHDWFHHRILYQEQIRVPLLISIPGREQKPAVGDLVRTKDILPTVLDYMQIPAPEGVSGRSLRTLIEGRPDAERLAFANQINGFDLDARMLVRRPLDDFVYVAMDRRWKLIYRPNHPDRSELYHLAEDPTEARNLYATAHPEAIRLKESLATSRPWVDRPYGASTDASTSETGMDEMRSALEALGYVEPATEPHRFVTPDWRWTCPADAAIVSDDPAARGACKTPLVPFVTPRSGDTTPVH